MNIDEIDIFDYFHKGFENDLKRINEAEPFKSLSLFVR